MGGSKSLFLPLTSLRFFFAIWVVIFHQTGPGRYLDDWTDRAPETVSSILRTGFVAVSLFFVLSGFVLAYNYPLEKPWAARQVKKFAVARFARIYPAYCLGLLLVLPFVASELYQQLAARFALKTAIHAVITAGLNWTLLQAWIPSTALTWNGPGWSLSNEAFFYFCFPVTGVALWKAAQGRKFWVTLLLLWIAAMVVPIIMVAVPIKGFGDIAATVWAPSAERWANFVKFNPLLRLPEFCAGILIARSCQSLLAAGHWLVGRGYWLYLPALLGEALLLGRAAHLPYPLIHNGLLLPLHAAVILGFALGGGWLSHALSGRWLVFLGNASYAMYILHAPIGHLLHEGTERAQFQGMQGWTGMTVYLCSVIGLSALTFKVIEEPFNRLLRQRRAHTGPA